MDSFSERLQANAKSASISWKSSSLQLHLNELTASGYLVLSLTLRTFNRADICISAIKQVQVLMITSE